MIDPTLKKGDKVLYMGKLYRVEMVNKSRARIRPIKRAPKKLLVNKKYLYKTVSISPYSEIDKL